MGDEPDDRSRAPTLDDPGRRPAVEQNAPTRYVRPHVDHAVANPRARPPSASQMAAQAPTLAEASEGVRGTLAAAAFEGGDFVIRLVDASASMRAMVLLGTAIGAEIEIVVRRRA